MAQELLVQPIDIDCMSLGENKRMSWVKAALNREAVRHWWLPCLAIWLAAMGTARAEDCYQYNSAIERLRCENGKSALERKYDANNGYYIMQHWQNEVLREEQARQEAQQRNERLQREREAADANANTPEGKAEKARKEKAAAEQFWRDYQRQSEAQAYWSKQHDITRKLILAAQTESMQRESRLYEIASKKGYLTEADYVILAASVAPNWQRMNHWVSEGKGKFGGRFELLEGVLQTMGCPEVDRVRESLEPNQSLQTVCDQKYSEQGNRIMLNYLPKASATDQLRICSFMYSQWMAHKHFATDEIIRFIDDRSDGPWYRSNEERFTDYYETCVSKARKVDRETMARHIKTLQFYPYSGRWRENYANALKEPDTQSGRWLMFNHPLLSTIEDFLDRAKVEQAVESARRWSKYIKLRGDSRNWTLRDAQSENIRLDWFFPTPEDPDDVQAEAEDRPVKRKDPA